MSNIRADLYAKKFSFFFPLNCMKTSGMRLRSSLFMYSLISEHREPDTQYKHSAYNTTFHNVQQLLSVME